MTVSFHLKITKQSSAKGLKWEDLKSPPAHPSTPKQISAITTSKIFLNVLPEKVKIKIAIKIFFRWVYIDFYNQLILMKLKKFLIDS